MRTAERRLTRSEKKLKWLGRESSKHPTIQNQIQKQATGQARDNVQRGLTNEGRPTMVRGSG